MYAVVFKTIIWFKKNNICRGTGHSSRASRYFDIYLTGAFNFAMPFFPVTVLAGIWIFLFKLIFSLTNRDLFLASASLEGGRLSAIRCCWGAWSAVGLLRCHPTLPENDEPVVGVWLSNKHDSILSCLGQWVEVEDGVAYTAAIQMLICKYNFSLLRVNFINIKRYK